MESDKKDFSSNVMDIIKAIQEHLNKYGNIDAVTSYYQTNGTCEGIIDYLSELEMKKTKDN